MISEDEIRPVECRETGEFHPVGNAGNRTGEVRNLFANLFGSLERRTVWQLGKDNEVTLVLGRNETRRHSFKPEVGQHEKPHVDQQGNRGQSQQSSDHPNVPFYARLESLVK